MDKPFFRHIVTHDADDAQKSPRGCASCCVMRQRTEGFTFIQCQLLALLEHFYIPLFPPLDKGDL